jgi:hypothetical protein
MTRLLLLALALGALAAGCGERNATPDEARAAAQVAGRFYAALGGGDVGAACSVLAQHGACTSGSFTDLPAEIRRDLTRVSTRPAGVHGGTVDVVVTGSGRFTGQRTETLEMKRVDGAWRIDGRPAAFDPDRVTQCIAGGIDTFEAGKTDAVWRLVGRAQYVYYVQHLCKRVVAENAKGAEVAAIGRSIFRQMERDGRLDAG